MKIRNEKGFAMLSVVVLSSLVFSYALSYMDIMVVQYRSIKAAENSLKAEAVSDAAVEEALWEYNYGGGDFTSADGWAASGSTRTKTSASLTNTAGSSVGTYTTTITNYNTSNAQISVSASTSSSGPNNTATTKVAITPRSAYTNALLSGGTITINGSNTFDSYISSSGSYGGSNRYSNADIATNSTANPAVTVNGSNTLKGDLGVGTGGGWTNSGSNTLTGAFSTGYATTIASNTAPGSLTGLSAVSAVTSGTINAGSYKYSSWTINGSNTITVNGAVSIYVAGDITINGSNNINLASGAVLTVYAGGNMTVNGSNNIRKSSGAETASSFLFYGTSATTNVTVNGSNNITGVINAPQASYTLNGSNNHYGSSIVSGATVNGSNNIRYDESLASAAGAGYKLKWSRRTA